ncbi:MAG TPA: phosphotransferase, partial [Pyrinomonadaceae bacterium]
MIGTMASSLTLDLLAHTPRFSIQTAATIAEELYGVRSTVSPLPSERDQNFLLIGESNEKFVLRIANGLEDPKLLAAQNLVLQYLSARVPFCQRPIASLQGRYLEEVTATDGQTNLVRLNTYLPGVPLGEIPTRSSVLLHDFGLKLGTLDKVLLDFDHPAVHRKFHWDLADWKSVIKNYCGLIHDVQLRTAVSRYEVEFERDVAPLLPKLRRSCIHGDPNDYNILIDPDSRAVIGLLDFGDIVYSYTIGDLAIALAYVVLNDDGPLTTATHVVAGYKEALPIENIEIKVLWDLMLMRLCMSVCLAAYQQQQQPNNEYLDISQQAILGTLPKLLAI